AFDYARRHRFLDGVAALDFQLLRTIKDMTSHLEVRQCTTGEWEQAILQGFEVWRAVLAARGGRIAVDLDARRVTFLGPSGSLEPRA
ncbi:MAG: nucleotide pyrophosphohydrolase, partial [Mesorhizobium sp.]